MVIFQFHVAFRGCNSSPLLCLESACQLMSFVIKSTNLLDQAAVGDCQHTTSNRPQWKNWQPSFHSDAQLCMKCFLKKVPKLFSQMGEFPWWFAMLVRSYEKSSKQKQLQGCSYETPSWWRFRTRFGILDPGIKKTHFTKPDDRSTDHSQGRIPLQYLSAWRLMSLHQSISFSAHVNGYFIILFQWQQTFSMTTSVGTQIKLMLMMLHGSTCI